MYYLLLFVHWTGNYEAYYVLSTVWDSRDTVLNDDLPTLPAQSLEHLNLESPQVGRLWSTAWVQFLLEVPRETTALIASCAVLYHPFLF